MSINIFVISFGDFVRSRYFFLFCFYYTFSDFISCIIISVSLQLFITYYFLTYLPSIRSLKDSLYVSITFSSSVIIIEFLSLLFVFLFSVTCNYRLCHKMYFKGFGFLYMRLPFLLVFFFPCFFLFLVVLFLKERLHIPFFCLTARVY